MMLLGLQLAVAPCLPLASTMPNRPRHTEGSRAHMAPSNLDNPSLLLERVKADLPDKVSHCSTHRCILWGHVFQVLAARVQETSNAQARAIELTDDMVANVAVNGNEISSPE